MKKEIEAYFEDFIVDRAIEVEEQIVNNNIKILKLGEECATYFKKILHSLSEEDKDLLFQYEEKRNFREMQCFQILYRQGVIDGIKATNIFNETRNRHISKL
ncbi:hypothetical protein R9X47_18690 [Wukongibacter baidiensis]|uniref:hypothetical protein n=1 Tax=Wukongibacter baidiensis TaxID=1723361 RepID=UPI003D7F60F1